MTDISQVFHKNVVVGSFSLSLTLLLLLLLLYIYIYIYIYIFFFNNQQVNCHIMYV